MNAKCSAAAAFTSRSKSHSLNERLLANLCMNFTFFQNQRKNLNALCLQKGFLKQYCCSDWKHNSIPPASHRHNFFPPRRHGNEDIPTIAFIGFLKMVQKALLLQ